MKTDTSGAAWPKVPNVEQIIASDLRTLDASLGGSSLLHYCRALNQSETTEYWRVQIPVGFLGEAWGIRRALDAVLQEQNICHLAWLARNALELRIWAQYVATGPEAAKRFHQDAYVDAVETLKLMNKVSLGLPTEYHGLVRDAIDPLLPEFEHVLARDQVGLSVQQLQTMKHLDPAKVAEEIGYEAVFTIWNRILSKLVHPTAYTVLVAGKSMEAIGIFLVSGITRELSAMANYVDAYIQQNGLPSRRAGSL